MDDFNIWHNVFITDGSNAKVKINNVFEPKLLFQFGLKCVHNWYNVCLWYVNKTHIL